MDESGPRPGEVILEDSEEPATLPEPADVATYRRARQRVPALLAAYHDLAELYREDHGT